MSYSRGDWYAFQDFTTGKLEINFPKSTAYKHNKVNECGGHLFDESDARTIITICELYLQDLAEQREKEQ